MSVAIHLELAVTKYAPPYPDLVGRQHSESNRERERERERGGGREIGAATRAADDNWSPGPCVTTVESTTFWRVLPLKVGTSSWKSWHRWTRAFCFVPHRKRFQISSLIALSNGSGSAQFSLSIFRTERGFRYVRYSSSTGLRTFMFRGELERSSSKYSTRQFQVPNYNSINRAHGFVSLALLALRAWIHADGPPACACKLRLHARARRNIVGVQRYTSLLVTSKIGPVKITHCD